MKNFPTQTEYLVQCGAFEEGGAAIDAAKKRYRTLYAREHQKRRREEQFRYAPYFTKQENKVLQQEAERHNLSPSAYIHKATVAYMHTLYLVPDPTLLLQLRAELYKVGSQLAILCRSVQNHPDKEEDLTELTALIEGMEHDLQRAIAQPQDLISYLKQAFQERPYLWEELQTTMNHHLYADR